MRLRYQLLMGLLTSICYWGNPMKGQVTWTNGDNTLELSGSISTYLNFRTLDSTSVEKDKDRFALRDAQMQLEGRRGDRWEYELQFDLADIAQGGTDPENPGIMDAWIKYKAPKLFDIRLGYGKVSWSRSSLTPFVYSAYWQRAEFLRGGFAARRDVGLELSRSFWKQRAGLWLGTYTGLGEQSLKGDNDASGAFEYVGRAEFSFPGRGRYREIDDRHLRIPQFSAGMSGRYTNRILPAGEFFPSGAAGDFGIKVINGKREAWGLDASLLWQGFSAQFEMMRIRSTPVDSVSSFLQGYSPKQSNGYFQSLGWTAQAAYHIKPIRLVLSGRYETYNVNDLFAGDNARYSFAIAYMPEGYRSMIKAQYIRVIRSEAIDAPDWVAQYRIGWQYQF